MTWASLQTKLWIFAVNDGGAWVVTSYFVERIPHGKLKFAAAESHGEYSDYSHQASFHCSKSP